MRAICPIISMDLPARATITNFKQYNGAYGCLYCTHPGVPKSDNSRGLCWLKVDCTLRTEAGILQCAEDPVESGDAVRIDTVVVCTFLQH